MQIHKMVQLLKHNIHFMIALYELSPVPMLNPYFSRMVARSLEVCTTIFNTSQLLFPETSQF